MSAAPVNAVEAESEHMFVYRSGRFKGVGGGRRGSPTEIPKSAGFG